MFVIDSTGSMGDELNYLKKEFTDIIRRIKDEYPNVAIRYGLIVYRDEGDEYVVRKFPFTSFAAAMQKQIEEQSANGGGDYEEAMHKIFLDQAVPSTQDRIPISLVLPCHQSFLMLIYAPNFNIIFFH